MTDVVIVGGGHNGLTCAAYLAKSGLSVTVLERRHIVGGACVTEELWPGFKSSRASYVCGLFRPRVVRDLGLKLPLLPRKPSSFTPHDKGGLLLGLNKVHDAEQIGRYSAKDAKAYMEFERVVGRLAGIVDPLLDVDAGDFKSPSSLLAYSKSLAGFAGSGKDSLSMLSLMMGSATNQLSSWFESEPLRSTLATDALIGTHAGPSTPGTGYVLVHHMMGGGSWSYVQGGMGTISAHLREKAESFGARILTDVAVEEIDMDRKIVTTRSGKTFEFRKAVVSNLNPDTTSKLVRSSTNIVDLDDFKKAVSNIDFASPVVKINVALDSIPQFHGTKPDEVGPQHQGTIHIGAQTLQQLDESYKAADRGQLPELPMMELTIPSAIDNSLAPSGKHICSIFVQHVPPKADEAFWKTRRDQFAKHCFRLIDEVSPGFSSRVLHYECLAPPDLERIFGLTGGNIFHGVMSLDRLLYGRPVGSHLMSRGSSYTTFHPRLFLCSAGTHPGGGVMGACGRNAALALLNRLSRIAA